MKPLPNALMDQMIANCRANQSGKSEVDHHPVVKLFTPDAQATWALSEYDPEEGLFFGACDLGCGFPELGYVALAEAQEARGMLGAPVERDFSFKADKPATAYAKQASAAGRIIT